MTTDDLHHYVFVLAKGGNIFLLSDHLYMNSNEAEIVEVPNRNRVFSFVREISTSEVH